MIWGDNAPLYEHANFVLDRIFRGEGINLTGNHYGGKLMKATEGGDGTLPGKLRSDHLVMTGVATLFEGITISYLTAPGPLKIIATYNDGPGYKGQPFCALADTDVYAKFKLPGYENRGRVAIDGGFTKLWGEYWDRTPGTARYVKNVSAWLVNIGQNKKEIDGLGDRGTLSHWLMEHWPR